MTTTILDFVQDSDAILVLELEACFMHVWLTLTCAGVNCDELRASVTHSVAKATPIIHVTLDKIEF